MTNYPSNELMQKIYSLLINTSFSLRIKPPAESFDLETAAKIVEHSALLFNDVSKNICRDKACKDFIEKTEKFLRDKYKTDFENNDSL
jgi:hypothetical protein